MAVRCFTQAPDYGVDQRMFMKIFLCSMGVLLLSESVLAAPCKISESVYREADGQGFELVFGAAPTGKP